MKYNLIVDPLKHEEHLNKFHVLLRDYVASDEPLELDKLFVLVYKIKEERQNGPQSDQNVYFKNEEDRSRFISAFSIEGVEVTATLNPNQVDSSSPNTAPLQAP